MHIALVTRWPRGGVLSGRREAGKDVEQARPAQRGGAVEEEVELACLALRCDGKVERYQRRDVGGLPVLKDLAGPGLEVYGAGRYLVLRAHAWSNDVGAGREDWGWGAGTAAERVRRPIKAPTARSFILV